MSIGSAVFVGLSGVPNIDRQTDHGTCDIDRSRPRLLCGNVTSAGWQVTLCDPMWHVIIEYLLNNM